MRNILAAGTLALVLLVPSSTAAVDNPKPFGFKVQQQTAKKQKRLVLPNIAAHVWQLKQADRSILKSQQRKSAQVLAFFKRPDVRWVLAPRQQKCWDVPWQRSCTIARATVRLHSALGALATRRLLYELPLTNDWVTAVRIAQRVYPGTADRLLRISDHEGGRGPWVWYAGSCGNPPCLWHGYHIGGDTVGGWEQFRYTTFAPYYRGMVKDLRARGFMIPAWPDRGGPAEYQPWLDPLGQALTAGYMHYYGKQGSHWPF